MAEERQPRLTRRGLLAAGAAAAVVPRLDLGRFVSPRSPAPVAPGLAIWPRESWAPGPPTGPLAAEQVRFLLVHHTAENTDHTAAQVPSILAAMYAFHTGPKGWHDIAYNFLVDREGGVWEGRAGSLAGPVAADATGGSQGFDQLVCFIGDFTSVTPTPAALDAGNRTLAWLAQRYSIDTSAGAKVTFVSRGSNKWPAGARVTTSTIAGHREMSTTACPGNAFYPYVRNQMQGAVQELRGEECRLRPPRLQRRRLPRRRLPRRPRRRPPPLPARHRRRPRPSPRPRRQCPRRRPRNRRPPPLSRPRRRRGQHRPRPPRRRVARPRQPTRAGETVASQPRSRSQPRLPLRVARCCGSASERNGPTTLTTRASRPSRCRRRLRRGAARGAVDRQPQHVGSRVVTAHVAERLRGVHERERSLREEDLFA